MSLPLRPLRLFALLALALIASQGARGAAPKRVASLNLCTDELLLLLAAPEQIASVTHLAQQQAESVLWRTAHRHKRNDGSLLSVASARPDLVLTMGGSGRDRAGIAERLGFRTIDLPFPQNLDDIERSIRVVASALGRKAAGDRLVGRLKALRRTAAPARVNTIWLGGGGRSVSPEGLGGQWMALAGLRQRRLTGDRVTLEELLVRPPRLLLRSDYRAGQFSSEQRWLDHPLARGAAKSRTIVTDGRAWTCMGPALIFELARLRKALS